MTRGGKRSGAGRPAGALTTGSSKRPAVFFRLSADDYDTASKASGGDVNGYAKRATIAKLRRAATREGSR